MTPLSIVIICKNEAAVIAPCLQSVAGLSDEIVVLDSGSTDGTRELCSARGARVIETDWLGFGPQKNRAVMAASSMKVLM